MLKPPDRGRAGVEPASMPTSPAMMRLVCGHDVTQRHPETHAGDLDGSGLRLPFNSDITMPY